MSGNNDKGYSITKLDFSRDGMKISGELYTPGQEGPYPLVILSHGFGATREAVRPYAAAFAENGIASYIFEFLGGGSLIQSEGKTTEMSVLTEASDLDVILNGLAGNPDIDSEKIFLCGQSQGGFVSTYTACKRPKDVAGLIALFPAYVIHDDCRQRNPDPDAMPESEEIMGMRIGRIYTKDALSFDIYDIMKEYTGKVLIIHGSEDRIEPLSYSERAVKEFSDAELVVLKGAGYIFYGEEEEKAIKLSVDFVRKECHLL